MRGDRKRVREEIHIFYAQKIGYVESNVCVLLFLLYPDSKEVEEVHKNPNPPPSSPP